MGKTFHPDHFVCTTCKVKLTGKIYQVNGEPTCDGCFNKQISLCEKCNQPISGQSLRALNKKWHLDCFQCGQCSVNIAKATFMEKNGTPYCETCFQNFAEKCKGCGLIITDQVFSALNEKWHVSCFTCTECNQPFSDDKPVFEKNGKPYCENHLPRTDPAKRASGGFRPLQPRPLPAAGNPPANQPSHPPISRGHPNDPLSQSTTTLPAPPVKRSLANSSSQSDGKLALPPNGNSSAVPPRRLPPRRNNEETPKEERKVSLVVDDTATLPTTSHSEPIKKRPQTFIETNAKSKLVKNEKIANVKKLLDIPLRTPGEPIESPESKSPSMNHQTIVNVEAKFFKDDPESKLTEIILNDLIKTLPWFGRNWENETEKTKEECISVVIRDIHDAMVASKKAGPLQVKTWTKSIASLNGQLSTEQYNAVFI